MDTNNNNNESYLKSLNKASMKIAKPTRKPYLPDPVQNPLLPTQQQPPVYNVSKNDFRQVVQQLTGSPAHQFPNTNNNTSSSNNNTINIPNRPSNSSRLQRIRPPPLVQINKQDVGSSSGFGLLPPLPSVHHASESPISAYMRVLGTNIEVGGVGEVEKEAAMASYMRFLHNSYYAKDSRVPPSVPHQQSQQQQQGISNKMEQQQGNVTNANLNGNGNGTNVNLNGNGSATNANLESSFPVMPVSPLAFGGCVPSPRGQYGMLGSPGSLLFSPTSGMPVSPLPSPTWKV